MWGAGTLIRPPGADCRGGRAGQMIACEIGENSSLGMIEVGSSMTTAKIGEIRGPGPGNHEKIEEICRKHVDEIIIAIPSAPSVVRHIVEHCRCSRAFRILPGGGS
jgi:hypothetical protein